MSNITQVVNTDKNMTTLKKGIHATDLDQVWSGTGPFTVFAPSDTAFGKLEAGTLEELLKPENKVKLTALLQHHVVGGKISFKDMKDGDILKSLDGKELRVSLTDGKATVDGSVIQNRDVASSNGIMHFIDTVLKN
jgi:uncharacterized surface protein with fasciclin (FAS1) repeats